LLIERIRMLYIDILRTTGRNGQLFPWGWPHRLMCNGRHKLGI